MARRPTEGRFIADLLSCEAEDVESLAAAVSEGLLAVRLVGHTWRLSLMRVWTGPPVLRLLGAGGDSRLRTP